MKRRINGISLMIALLMIISTFTVITPSTLACQDGYPGEVVFTKTVWDKDTEEWVDETTAIIGETVRFNITVTYYMDEYWYDIGKPLSLYNINITDELPPCLEYVACSATINPSYIDEENKIIYWNLTDTLHDGDSRIIYFDAVVVVSDELVNVNFADMTAVECGMYEHYEYDTATVYVRDELVVEKEVWNGNEWAESVDYVIKNQTLRFRITITYYGPYTLEWMKVTDWLPTCCLEYADNVVITGAKAIEPNVEDGVIEWYWTHDEDFELKNGETVMIEFDTKVINYCGEQVCNGVLVNASFYCNPKPYAGYDEACINCVPPEPTFEKKVWNGDLWVEETSVFVGDTVRFKIELTYYGIGYLKNIEIVDELPCCLEYANNANIEETSVSEDKRTIIWDLEEELEDGETLSIEFDALVVDITSPCGCNGINTASYDDYSGSDTANITSTHRPRPPRPPIKIKIRRFSVAQVLAKIENVGEEDAADIKWSIWVRSGAIVPMMAPQLQASGTIDLLEAGKSKTISSKTNFRSRIVRKFGRISITVEVTVGEDTYTKTACGFVVGRLIIVKAWI